MNFFKNIFGRIWAVWGLIFFTITLLLVVGPIWLTKFIDEPRGTNVFRKISKGWMSFFLTIIGCPLSVKGKHHFKKGQSYIVACNHNSLMDVPLTTPFIPGPNKTIAKVEMAKIPLFGTIYRRGSVLVDRKSDESRRKSLEDMKRVLAQGMHMCIYPEGTRNKTDQPLKSFYDGAFRLAVDTGTPIIPTIIRGTGKVLPTNKFFFLWPHKLSMKFLEQVPVSKTDNPVEVREKVFKIMWDELSKNPR